MTAQALTSLLAVVAAMAGDGLVLIADGDTIRVRGPAPARARWLPVIRERKTELLALLRSELGREAFEERAAIAEYLGGLPRAEAEALAWESVKKILRMK
ncbi:hypothetical protein [Tepidimonas charontis]|uniref:TubC N-terminal docking domain-containing protein n=1 Tax=Tepidimonas charontis TaxID=2267262 RepID=A0A554X8E8_9BURK|nr:hypothetical protein [Tepidimonas charontis]TSE32104.1 hypothetical protein Tchar_02191 [Tepidimonas charontis]